MTIVIILAILTNISSVYLAKRALTQASEAAAQRGVRNLDLDTYYQSEYNLWQFAGNLFGEGEIDPGIPIDCQKGQIDAYQALSRWIELSNLGSFSHGRSNLNEITINRIDCDGYEMTISTSAKVSLPFVIPFTELKSVAISSHISSIAQRKITTNYYGIDIQ